MREVYYIIYSTATHNGKEYPSYLQLINDGRLLQTSIYDASKYINKANAEKEMRLAKKAFKDKKFDIIPMDRRIFGNTPRWIEDENGADKNNHAINILGELNEAKNDVIRYMDWVERSSSNSYVSGLSESIDTYMDIVEKALEQA